MDFTPAEKIIASLDVELYPITLMKLLMNFHKLERFEEIARGNNIKYLYKVNNTSCKACNEKKSLGILCRQHTSIDRVIKASVVLYDTDSGYMLYKNEIFKIVGDKLLIIYCPHTKLINGDITDSKVRKVNPITVCDQTITKDVLEKKIKKPFSSQQLKGIRLSCWFNNLFTLIIDDGGKQFYLTPNRRN